MNTHLSFQDVFNAGFPHYSSVQSGGANEFDLDGTFADDSGAVNELSSYMNPQLLFAENDLSASVTEEISPIPSNSHVDSARTTPEQANKRMRTSDMDLIYHAVHQKQPQQQQLVHKISSASPTAKNPSSSSSTEYVFNDVNLKHLSGSNPNSAFMVPNSPYQGGFKSSDFLLAGNPLFGRMNAANMMQRAAAAAAHQQHFPSPPTSVNTTPKSMSKTPIEVPEWHSGDDFMMNMMGTPVWKAQQPQQQAQHQHQQQILIPNINLGNWQNSALSAAMAKKKCVWTPEEDSLLLRGFQMYPKQWAKIASMIPGRTNQQVKQRWSYVLNEDIRNGPWSEEEDRLLLEGFNLYGKQWAKIASMIPGRTNIQCRNRWKDVLDPSIKSEAWSAEEDEILQNGYLQYGSRWAKISALLPGRTGLQCRDRFLRKNFPHRKRK